MPYVAFQNFELPVTSIRILNLSFYRALECNDKMYFSFSYESSFWNISVLRYHLCRFWPILIKFNM